MNLTSIKINKVLEYNLKIVNFLICLRMSFYPNFLKKPGELFFVCMLCVPINICLQINLNKNVHQTFPTCTVMTI